MSLLAWQRKFHLPYPPYLKLINIGINFDTNLQQFGHNHKRRSHPSSITIEFQQLSL